jgi:hypothetical protein
VTRANARHQLAGLTALEALVEIAMHALIESYHELHRDPRPGDSAESATAGTLVDRCAQLLTTIDAHRRHVARHLDPEDRRWPF